jgi:hypothetical protein
MQPHRFPLAVQVRPDCCWNRVGFFVALQHFVLYPPITMTRAKDAKAPATKADLERLREDLFQRFASSVEDMRRYFDIVAETLKKDLSGAFSDRTVQHREAIERLEHRVTNLEHRLDCALSAA